MEFSLSFQEVLKVIKEKLSLKIPFLILRVGDGEAFVIEKHELWFSKILHKHTGIYYKNEQLEIIRNNLIEAINNSDLVGIHNPKIQNNFGRTYGIVSNFCNIENKKIVCVNFPYDFLDKWVNKDSCYDLLLQGMDELFVVSGRQLSDGFKRRFKVKNVKTFLVPPEFAYESDPNNGKKPHFPDRFYEIKSEIESMGNLRGKLLIYGAGIIGKIYGLYWRNQGGVAVDIGSVLDYFAGKKTRGRESTATSIDLTYKL